MLDTWAVGARHRMRLPVTKPGTTPQVTPTFRCRENGSRNNILFIGDAHLLTRAKPLCEGVGAGGQQQNPRECVAKEAAQLPIVSSNA